MWQDRRAAVGCERLQRAGAAERLTAITGLELDPYFVAPKVVWLRDAVSIPSGWEERVDPTGGRVLVTVADVR